MLHHAQKSWFKLYIWTQLWDEQGSGKVQLLKSCSAAMRRALSFVSVCGVSTGSNTHTRPVKGLSRCVCMFPSGLIYARANISVGVNISNHQREPVDALLFEL